MFYSDCPFSEEEMLELSAESVIDKDLGLKFVGS